LRGDHSPTVPCRSTPVLCRNMGGLCHSVPSAMQTRDATENRVSARDD
jgi:hypothetical protein